MSNDTSILVIGAGELGMPILGSLSRYAPSPTSTKISVLVRPATIASEAPDKKEIIAKLRALGISMLSGDIVNSSPAELSNLFKPFHTIVGCTGFSAGPSIQLKVAHAVLDAGVSRYFPWQFGVDYDIIGRGSAQDLFDEQLDVRDLLRGQSKTEWVIISTGMFTSFLFEPSFEVVDLENDNVHALGNLSNEVTLTTPEDIGKLTALILFDENPRIVNEVVYVAGDTVTYGEVAQCLEQEFGRKFKRSVWSVETLENELESDPDNFIRKYRIVFAKAKGVAWPIKNTYNAQKKVDVQTLKGWVHDHLGSLA